MVMDLDSPVTASELRLSEIELNELVAKVARSEEEPIEVFAASAWGVLCEPGDAFAGQLIAAFGAARALAFEIMRTSPSDYIEYFAAAGSDWAALQKFGRFERTVFDARERWSPRLTISAVRESVNSMATVGAWFITAESELWPEALNDLGFHSPRGIWVRGQESAIASLSKSFSVVGSRIATNYGERVTPEILEPLCQRGYSIVSGGAYGIDTMAHRSALGVAGKTVAVMAGGLDRLYPSGNTPLFRQIESEGALISEMPAKAEPTKWRFLQRNRLIAALGEGTIVVEANPRSGAVSTANRALELGRPLGAVPGPINSAGSDGCHQLIRDHGAELITCAADALVMIGVSQNSADLNEGLGALETRVLDVIGHSGANLSQIRTEAGLTNSEAEQGLAGLVLAGRIRQDSNVWRKSEG
jgi:DNA processing protein